MKTIKDVQEYWNKRPCNLKHSPESIGTKKYFTEVRDRKYFVEPHIPDFADFPRWQNKKVLEIGCGLGTDTQSFAEFQAYVTAIDLSDASLILADKRMELFGLKNRVNFYQGNVEILSEYIPITTYDLIYSFGVLHHTPQPIRAFKELKSFMGPNSTMKIMVYYKYSWKVFWILLKYGHGAFWKLKQLIAENSEAAFGCPITYVYSKKEIKQLLEECGYKVTTMKIEHIFSYSIPEYRKYQYKKVWYFRWMPKPLFHFLENLVGWHLCVEAKLK